MLSLPALAAGLLLLAQASAGGLSSDPPMLPKTLKPPIIDGVLDDEAWSAALKVEGFKTYQPDYGREPNQRSEGFLTYDSDNFYFALRCYETEPGKIKAATTKRDAIFDQDFCGLLIDTFNDMQSAFGFVINPLGIQGDGMMDIKGNLDSNFDMVWDSKGRIDEQGYAVEGRVPLQSIRFPNKKDIIIRVAFFRQIVRASEMDSYPAMNPEQGSLLGQTLAVRVSGLKYKRVIEVLPALTHTTSYAHSEGLWQREMRSTEFSLTGKLGITSDLIADAAYNPDFSQVESDAGQVDINLRYDLFYPEKRPFFLEGSELWLFAGNFEEAPLTAVVYTRKIINPVFGLKLAGKISAKDTLAAIYAQDELPGDEVDEHPDFTIVRYKHALRGDSYIGGFYTGHGTGDGFNRFGGADGRFRVTNTSVVSFHLFGSWTREQGAETVRPGHALGLDYSYSTRSVNLDIGYQDISPDFQVDTGYAYRTGLRRLALFGMYTFYPDSKFFQKIEPFYWSYHLYDTIDRMFQTTNLFTLRFWLPRSTLFRVDFILANEVYAGGRFGRNQLGLNFNSQIAKSLFLYAFWRYGGAIYYDPETPYQGYGNRAEAEVTFQPTENLDFDLSLTYSDFYRESNKEKIYDYAILRSRNTYQVNKYLFLRAIFEYNTYRKRLTADFLASFTYIPGTVIYVGYGSAFQKVEWDGQDYVESDRYLETRRGFFFKVSYLWRY